MSITNKDVTGGEVTGSGFFDELMRASKDHLVQEYDAGRLVGAEYGAAYLGVMQSNLQVATQFILQREINNQQALLLQEQVQQGVKQNELLNKQIAQAQLEIDTAQYNLDFMLPEQLATQTEQTKLVTQQIAESVAKIALTNAQVVQSNAQSAAQVALTGKQEDLVDKQILTENTQTTDPTGGLAKKAFDKAQEEINLLNQKKVTETAQTSGDVDTLGGVVAAEMTLKKQQAEAFLRDAEQKAAKIYSDTFAILYSQDATVHTPSGWGINTTDSAAVLTKLKDSVIA